MALLKPRNEVTPQTSAPVEYDAPAPEALEGELQTPATDLAPVEPRRDMSPAEYHATDRAGTSLPDYEAAGFEGVEIGNRTFPIVALKNDGVFEDSDQRPWGKSITGFALSAKKKWVMNASKQSGGRTDTQVLFSFDRVNTTGGRPVAAVVAEWEAEGRTIGEWKEYRDILFQVVAPGSDRDEELVILSVSPTSVGRWNNKVIRLTLGTKDPSAVQDKISSHLLTVAVGTKVTQGVVQPFYPWDFSFSKTAA